MSVDDGLRALTRRRPDDALAHWRELIVARSTDAEPYVFASQLLLILGERGTNAESAITLADHACQLDPRWAEAWLLAGEWRVTLALTEGRRRTAGTTRLFRLDEVLDELGMLGRVLECYRRAADLDDGRLGRLLAHFAGLWKTSEGPVYALEPLEPKGRRADAASGPRPIDLLRRAGLHVEPAPPPSGLVDMARARGDDIFVVVVPPPAFYDTVEAFADERLDLLSFVTAHSTEWLEEQVPAIVERGLAVIGAPAVAYNAVDWSSAAPDRRVRVWWFGVEALSVGECLGGMTWTSPAVARAGVERRWFAGRLALRN